VFPVVDSGRLLGCAGLHQAKEVPRENWGRVRVGDLELECEDAETVDADTDAADALEHMQSHKRTRLMVTDDGKLVGMLVLKDLLRYLQVRAKLEQQ
jgi:predicted transcriptional regulator